MKVKKKAQAVLEIGTLGALILVAFAVLLSYIQRLNDDQYTLMSNFRQALKEAHDNNAIVSYTTLEDRRHLNLYSPLEGQRTMVSSSNNVHWSVPFVGAQPPQLMVYNINGTEYKIPQTIDLGGGASVDFAVDNIIYDYDTETKSRFDRDEKPDEIVSTRTVDIDEDMLYILNVKPSLSMGSSSGEPAMLHDMFVDTTLDEIEERLEEVSGRESGVLVPIWQTRKTSRSRTWITEQESE